MLGDRIKELRTEQGLSVDSLSWRTGVDSHTIWRLERGHTANPRIDTVVMLAAVLGVSIEELIGDPSNLPLSVRDQTRLRSLTSFVA